MRNVELLSEVANVRAYQDYDYPLAMTREEFEAWAPTVDERWEWIEGYAYPAPLDFAGGTWRHAEIVNRLHTHLANNLVPPCRVSFGDLFALRTPRQNRYGDLFIVCEQIELSATAFDHPTVIIEVVSESSTERDLVDKRGEYLSIDGLEAYAAFFADKQRAFVYTPNVTEPTVREDEVTLHGVRVDLATLYAGLIER